MNPSYRPALWAVMTGCLLCLALPAAATEDKTGSHDSVAVSWLARLGGDGPDVLYAMQADAMQQITLGGVFFRKLYHNDQLVLSSFASSQDAFIARLGADGELLWSRGFGGDRNDGLSDIAIDSNGHVLATGYYSGSGRFSGTGTIAALQPAGLSDIYLLELDGNGVPLQASSLGGEYGDVGRTLQTLPDGGVWLTGQFQLAAGFSLPGQSPAILNSQGSTDVGVAHFDAAGTTRWLRQLGGAELDTVSDATSCGQDGLALTGIFHGPARWAQTELARIGSSDVYLICVDAHGELEWVRTFGNEKSDYPGRLAATSDGGVVFAGNLQGAWDIDGGQITSAGSSDMVVMRWNSEGELQWARRFGGANPETADAVSIGPDGKVYIAGGFTAATEIAGRQLNTQDSDAFLMVLDAAGAVTGVHHFPAKGVERILAVQILAAKELVIGGIFQQELAIGAEPLASLGKSDIFVARITLP